MKNLELYLDDQLINSMYNDMDINSIYNNMDISSIEPHNIEPHNIEPHNIEPHNIEPHNIEPPCPSEIKEDTNEFKNTIEQLDKKINKIKKNRNVARGRGRYKQLKTMTKDEIRKEQNQSLESNRLAAKKCRLKKKFFINQLEFKIDEQIDLIKSLQKEIKKIKGN
jgi:tRNA(Ile)-lysidine synthase TilS/MesJ